VKRSVSLPSRRGGKVAAINTMGFIEPGPPSRREHLVEAS
jgi:hypothetical protein